MPARRSARGRRRHVAARSGRLSSSTPALRRARSNAALQRAAPSVIAADRITGGRQRRHHLQSPASDRVEHVRHADPDRVPQHSFNDGASVAARNLATPARGNLVDARRQHRHRRRHDRVAGNSQLRPRINWTQQHRDGHALSTIRPASATPNNFTLRQRRHRRVAARRASSRLHAGEHRHQSAGHQHQPRAAPTRSARTSTRRRHSELRADREHLVALHRQCSTVSEPHHQQPDHRADARHDPECRHVRRDRRRRHRAQPQHHQRQRHGEPERAAARPVRRHPRRHRMAERSTMSRSAARCRTAA